MDTLAPVEVIVVEGHPEDQITIQDWLKLRRKTKLPFINRLTPSSYHSVPAFSVCHLMSNLDVIIILSSTFCYKFLTYLKLLAKFKGPLNEHMDFS